MSELNVDTTGFNSGCGLLARKQILLVEDDKVVVDYVQEALERHGDGVDVIGETKSVKSCIERYNYDILIMDRRLPDGDGLSVVSQLRSDGYELPILLITSMFSVHDRVCGLEGGADDYLVKPFAIDELLARIEALCRRPSMKPFGSVLEVSGIQIDTINLEVRCEGILVDLKPREFTLLRMLMEYPNRTVTRRMLLREVWGLSFDPGTTVIETYISRLRASLSAVGKQSIIENVRGYGYRINDH